MRIDNETGLVVLLGNPLGQSFSTGLQNAIYEELGINLVYLAEEIEAQDLGPVLAGLRLLNFAGCGITKPYKIEIMQYLDEIDPFCKIVGACNTIVSHKGKLIGYNTDGDGFYRSFLRETGRKTAPDTVFCIGAGGAGRSICVALAQHGVEKIYVTDFQARAAKRLCTELGEQFETKFEMVPHGEFDSVKDSDLVINASGIGMGNTIGQSPLPKEYMEAGKLYFDACYNPVRTQFLLDAGCRGGLVWNGLGMLAGQAAAQIELWSGIHVPEKLVWDLAQRYNP